MGGINKNAALGQDGCILKAPEVTAALIPGPGAGEPAGRAEARELSGREERTGSMSEESGKAPKINSADCRVLLKPGHRPSRLCQREQRLTSPPAPWFHKDTSQHHPRG